MVGMVVQFNEKHKWCGSLGIVTEVKDFAEGTTYMVGVPIPEKGTAYIYATLDEVEYIGKAVFMAEDE